MGPPPFRTGRVGARCAVRARGAAAAMKAMAPQHRVSESERRFLLDGVAQGMRNDGRGCFDYRRASVAPGTWERERWRGGGGRRTPHERK